MKKDNDNNNSGSNALLWIVGLGIVGVGGYFLFKTLKNKKNTTVVNIPSEPTTPEPQPQQQQTIKERAKDLAKDATANATSNLIDSLFNRMFR